MLSRKGQYIMEYAILIAIAAAAIAAMQIYVRRAVNSKLTAVGYEYHYLGEDWASKHPGGEVSAPAGPEETGTTP